MYATSGSAARRLGSAARARTSLAPGRFQRWMLDVRVAPFVHEFVLFVYILRIKHCSICLSIMFPIGYD